MCLAIPGKIVQLFPDQPQTAMVDVVGDFRFLGPRPRVHCIRHELARSPASGCTGSN